MTDLVSLERTRRSRSRHVKDIKAAVKAGMSLELRTAKIEHKTADWAEWFRDRMNATASDNPSDLLPEAFARLEQLNVDAINGAITELTGKLKRALT
jgi:hypothetical protein